MTAQDSSDDDHALLVSIAETDIELGALRDMSTVEAGMFLLAAMESSSKPSWSAGDLGNHALASAHERVTRRDGRPSRALDDVIPPLISDALSWLISNGLVGPGAWSSGASADWVITRAGDLTLAHSSAAHIEALQRLHVDLHPALEGPARANFERGEYEVAVFAAMKAVEVTLREAAGLGPDRYGTGLVTEALKPGGPFTINTATPNEQQALLQLFNGAIGVFKNPSSHRAIHYDDPTEAADIIHLANLLLRIIDREKQRRNLAQ